MATGLFLIIGFFIIAYTACYPISDFGNYYYGSKLYLDGLFSIDDYKSLHHFNKQIASYGATNYFENYTPVPPFSLLFYIPFTFLSCIKAKVVFNIISLLAFCYSYLRFIDKIELNTKYLYLLPLVFIYPLYNNIIQGQSYLLITSLLMEVFLADENKKYLKSAIFLSLTICLKIFPVFILVYFILKKNYRVVVYTLLLVLLIQAIVVAFVGPSIVFYYHINVLPRLVNNDIIGTYYYSNQSLYTLLLNLFSFEEIHNNHPLLNISWLVPFVEGIFVSSVLVVLYLLRKKESFLLYGIVLFGLILIGRYNTTYSMLILIPFTISLIRNNLNTTRIVLLLLFFGLSAPLYKFSNDLIIMQYTRLIVLIFIYFIILRIIKPKMELVSFVIITVIVTAFKFMTFRDAKPSYFITQNSKGILYDYDFKNNSLFLKSTLGYLDYTETVHINGNVKQNNSLFIENNILYYKGEILDDFNDNKLKPFFYNDSLVVFMSDLNQGVGFYKLRTVCLK